MSRARDSPLAESLRSEPVAVESRVGEAMRILFILSFDIVRGCLRTPGHNVLVSLSTVKCFNMPQPKKKSTTFQL